MSFPRKYTDPAELQSAIARKSLVQSHEQRSTNNSNRLAVSQLKSKKDVDDLVAQRNSMGLKRSEVSSNEYKDVPNEFNSTDKKHISSMRKRASSVQKF
jgi:hypothetical protein